MAYELEKQVRPYAVPAPGLTCRSGGSQGFAGVRPPSFTDIKQDVGWTAS